MPDERRSIYPPLPAYTPKWIQRLVGELRERDHWRKRLIRVLNRVN